MRRPIQPRCLSTIISMCCALLVSATMPLHAATPTPIATELQPYLGTLESAKLALDEQKPGRAWTLLAPLEAELAGNIDYDYLLGVAALDTGRATESTFIFQRILAQDPLFAGARMELARAWFELEQYTIADKEFQLLEETDPPPPANVASIIADYRGAINRLRSTNKGIWYGFTEFEGGYSNNANGATKLNSFLNFPLNENSRQTESPFYGVLFGGQFSKLLTPRWNWRTSLSLQDRRYIDLDIVNLQQGVIGTLLEYSAGTWGVGTGLTSSYARLDAKFNNYLVGLDVNGWKRLGQHWQIKGGVRGAMQRYANRLSFRDVNQLLLNASVERQFHDGRQTAASLSLLGGREWAQEADGRGNKPYGRDLSGAQFSVSSQLNPITRISLNGGVLYSKFNGPFFNAPDREDRLSNIAIVLQWAELPGLSKWRLRNHWGYARNASDTVLFEYESFEVGFSLRREFGGQ